MDPVSPLGFTRIEEQMEDSVQRQQPEYFGRLGRVEGQRTAQE
jgi:hypothetical protein